MVDDEDYEQIKDISWHGGSRRPEIKGYDRHAKKSFPLPRLLIGLFDSRLVDHINGNTLDNRKENLRPCTPQQNVWNSRKHIDSRNKYKCVYKKPNGKFYTQIGLNKKIHYIGVYDTEEEAALAYNQKAIEFFGEFASLNKI